MNSQVSKFEKEQALNNKIMLISILVFGSVLFTVLLTDQFKTYYTTKGNSPGLLASSYLINETEEDPSDVKRDALPSKLVSLQADLSNIERMYIEKSKLASKMIERDRAVYNELLNGLASVEEPELLISEILPIIKSQTEEYKHIAKVITPDPYIEAMYKQKVKEVELQIEEGWKYKQHNKNKLMAQNSKYTGENLNKVKHIKTAATTSHSENAKLFSFGQSDYNHHFEAYLMVEKEEPLKVEGWMLDDNCWCPHKNEKEWIKEPFAFIGK